MKREDYPLTLTAYEVADILRVYRDKAYEIIRRPDFPKIRDGRKIIIPRDAFFRWLDNSYASVEPSVTAK